MYRSYFDCNKLTGNPTCGSNTIHMSGAYTHCHNLTGSPVCGANVVYMA
jgi:hypothetical protein